MPLNLRRASARLCGAVALGACSFAWAAVIPPGTPLPAKQEMARNNGVEPESLDPALVESVFADLFEGLTAVDNHGQVVQGRCSRGVRSTR